MSAAEPQLLELHCIGRDCERSPQLSAGLLSEGSIDMYSGCDKGGAKKAVQEPPNWVQTQGQKAGRSVLSVQYEGGASEYVRSMA